jgi:hypothetical protein
MEKLLILLLIFFIFVGVFIVKTSKFMFEGYSNKKSSEERLLNKQIDRINKGLNSLNCDNTLVNF